MSGAARSRHCAHHQPGDGVERRQASPIEPNCRLLAWAKKSKLTKLGKATKSLVVCVYVCKK